MRYSRILLAALATLIIADAITTIIGLQNGYPETNPYAHSLHRDFGILTGTLFITTIKLLALYGLHKSTQHLPWTKSARLVVYIPLVLLHGHVVASNALLLA